MKIPLASPDITESDIDAVAGVLRSSQLSLGPKLSEFEDRFATYIGVLYAVALSSGTAGLHLGLKALGIGEGDEIILPSFAFIAERTPFSTCVPSRCLPTSIRLLST